MLCWAEAAAYSRYIRPFHCLSEYGAGDYHAASQVIEKKVNSVVKMRLQGHKEKLRMVVLAMKSWTDKHQRIDPSELVSPVLDYDMTQFWRPHIRNLFTVLALPHIFESNRSYSFLIHISPRKESSPQRSYVASA
jgi:hypothetical protein